MRSPWTRMRGGSPAITWRSEPLRMYMLRRNSLINDIDGSRSTGAGAGAGVLAGARACGGGRRRIHPARQHSLIGDEALELLAVGRVAVGVVGIDELGAEGVQQRLIHELHPNVLAGLQLRRNLMR